MMTNFTARRIKNSFVQLFQSPPGGDGTTRAVNEQLLVGLTEKGNQSLDSMADGFSFEMRMGEAMLNHYLTTGKRLPLQDAVAIASKQK